MRSPQDVDVNAWLRSFESAVATEDFDAGRSLFAEDILAYGTLTPVVTDLGSLLDRQWRPVWTRTHAFHFTHVDGVVRVGQAAVVAARWASESGSGSPREGRCTLLLAGEPFRCVHSHFSMTPEDGARLA